jgi:haloalkane dehalogenase
VTYGVLPFAEKKFIEIRGRRMAYIDEGDGAPIVFQHGNPTSSYLWRNVMPACRGLGRLIACDLIGMGDSDKLLNSNANSYTYAEHRQFIFALWEELGIDRDVVFVLHDWAPWLAFEWARLYPGRTQGIAYMEAVVMPLTWDDLPEAARDLLRGFRSPAGEKMALDDNIFVEKLLPGLVLRELSNSEMAIYRKPYLNAGEDRRPTLAAPQSLPIAGSPADVAELVAENAAWIANSPIPKLYIHAEPGALDQGAQREFCRKWPNQIEATVRGAHFIQEDSPEEIGAAVADFVRGVRSKN